MGRNGRARLQPCRYSPPSIRLQPLRASSLSSHTDSLAPTFKDTQNRASVYPEERRAPEEIPLFLSRPFMRRMASRQTDTPRPRNPLRPRSHQRFASWHGTWLWVWLHTAATFSSNILT